MVFPRFSSVKSRLFHGTKTRSSLDGYELILSSLFVWEYLRSSAKNLSHFLQGISKDWKMIGNIWHIPMILHEVFLNRSFYTKHQRYLADWPWTFLRRSCQVEVSGVSVPGFLRVVPFTVIAGRPRKRSAEAEILWQRSGWWGGTPGWYISG